MTEEILRREGNNILNEAGENVARFEANNIIGNFGGGGGGSLSIKSFTYTGVGDNSKTEITLPEDAHFILSASSLSQANFRMNWGNVPVIDGIYSILQAYVGGSKGTNVGTVEISGRKMTITSLSDRASRYNDEGQLSTFYYI